MEVVFSWLRRAELGKQAWAAKVRAEDDSDESHFCPLCGTHDPERVEVFAKYRASTEPGALIEHCAALAVAYMQDQDDWKGTVADCGYLRNAIINGDHSTIRSAEPGALYLLGELMSYDNFKAFPPNLVERVETFMADAEARAALGKEGA